MSEQEFRQRVIDTLDHIVGLLENGAGKPAQKSEWFNEDGIPVGKRVLQEDGEWGWVHKGDWSTGRKACKDCEAPIMFILSKMGPTPKRGEPKLPETPKWVAMNPEGSCHYDTCKVKVKDNLAEQAAPQFGTSDEVPF